MLSEAEPVLVSCFNLVSFGGNSGCLAILLLGPGAGLLTYNLRFCLFLPSNFSVLWWFSYFCIQRWCLGYPTAGSYNKHLSACHVPGTAVGAGSTAGSSTDDNPACPHGACR